MLFARASDAGPSPMVEEACGDAPWMMSATCAMPGLRSKEYSTPDAVATAAYDDGGEIARAWPAGQADAASKQAEPTNAPRWIQRDVFTPYDLLQCKRAA